VSLQDRASDENEMNRNPPSERKEDAMLNNELKAIIFPGHELREYEEVSRRIGCPENTNDLFNIKIENILNDNKDIIGGSSILNEILNNDEPLDTQKRGNESLSFISNNQIVDTITFEEIINTQDLRKLLPKEERGEQQSIDEILNKYGITFFDRPGVLASRRFTISKVKTPVDPGKVEYYREFLSRKMQHYNSFCDLFEKKIHEDEVSIGNLEKDVMLKKGLLDGKDSILRGLKTLKLSSKTKIMIEWYELTFYSRMVAICTSSFNIK
jgi:hypothetical protein